MTYDEVLKSARGNMGPYCKVCPVCNGAACKNQMPGPGAKGVGDNAVRNYQKWQEIRVNMDTIHENKPIDTSVEFFGRTFKYPFFAGPVGAMNMYHFSRRPLRIMERNMTIWLTTIFWWMPVQKAGLPHLPVMEPMQK